MPRSRKSSSEEVSPSKYNLRSAGKVPQANGNGTSQDGDHNAKKLQKQRWRKEREQLVLWKSPFTTLRYFVMELLCICYDFTVRIKPLWPQLSLVGSLLMSIAFAYHYLEMADHALFVYLRKQMLWCLYWIFLGILSSVGLGTGLHTFVLYLGPHIARVTLAAYECSSVEFPEPPYPDDVLCPEVVGESKPEEISIWLIMNKVRLEAMMWGLGTGIGELPPYFVARAARLSGETESDSDDEDAGEAEEELRELQNLLESRPDELSFPDRMKLRVHWLIQRVGFWGILLCASIPNPLFDLAGITCGHFLVPFMTFFGATAIGKAVIKMHIQQIFVIFLFSAHHVENLVALIGKIPGGFGSKLQLPFKEVHLHRFARRFMINFHCLISVLGQTKNSFTYWWEARWR